MSAREDYPNVDWYIDVNKGHVARQAAAALDEIDRLRELIRRALADGMGVLDEPDYDLYAELAGYLATVKESSSSSPLSAVTE